MPIVELIDSPPTRSNQVLQQVGIVGGVVTVKYPGGKKSGAITVWVMA